MKVSLIQMDVTKGKPEENKSRAVSLIERASREGPDVILLPEMWNTGYSLSNIREIADRNGRWTDELMGALARKYKVNICAGSVSNIIGEGVYNTMVIYDRKGKRKAEYSKIHLFRLMDEQLYLSSGDSVCTFEMEDHLWGGIICYDLRFPELTRLLALKGAKVLFVPAQWPHPRLDHWRILLQARAIENQLFVVACNRGGKVDENTFFGNSMVIDPWGKILGELENEKEGILTVDIDIDQVNRIRKSIPVFEDRRPGVYESSFTCDADSEMLAGYDES